jgi:hypothetical protein
LSRPELDIPARGAVWLTLSRRKKAIEKAAMTAKPALTQGCANVHGVRERSDIPKVHRHSDLKSESSHHSSPPGRQAQFRGWKKSQLRPHLAGPATAHNLRVCESPVVE